MRNVFSVKTSNKAEKQLREVEKDIYARAIELFKTLEQNPVPAKQYNLLKIVGRADTYRVRLSSYRVIYTVFWEEKIVRILKIERRSETTY